MNDKRYARPDKKDIKNRLTPMQYRITQENGAKGQQRLAQFWGTN